MEEIEASTEALQEEIHHHAHAAKESWVSQVALSSALFAVFAAFTALLANHHANEAMIEQIQASDQWSYYQAKGIKANLLAMKMDLLSFIKKGESQKPAYKKDQEKLSEYKNEQERISEKAKEREYSSENHLKHHIVLARGVTLFQVAIAIAAISILTQQRKVWFLGLGFGSLGLAFLFQGIFFVS